MLRSKVQQAGGAVQRLEPQVSLHSPAIMKQCRQQEREPGKKG